MHKIKLHLEKPSVMLQSFSDDYMYTICLSDPAYYASKYIADTLYFIKESLKSRTVYVYLFSARPIDILVLFVLCCLELEER